MAEVNVASITQYPPEGASASIIAKTSIKIKLSRITMVQRLCCLPVRKKFSAVAAKLVLGDAFQFETSLLSNGKIQNNVLEGDLVVQFTGDPDLTSGQLYSLLANLKNQGIQKINGDLILDTSVFASHDRGLGWIWNDLTMCFNSPSCCSKYR